MPLWPPISPHQSASASCPSGVKAPNPVTTTHVSAVSSREFNSSRPALGPATSPHPATPSSRYASSKQRQQSSSPASVSRPGTRTRQPRQRAYAHARGRDTQSRRAELPAAPVPDARSVVRGGTLRRSARAANAAADPARSSPCDSHIRAWREATMMPSLRVRRTPSDAVLRTGSVIRRDGRSQSTPTGLADGFGALGRLPATCGSDTPQSEWVPRSHPCGQDSAA